MARASTMQVMVFFSIHPIGAGASVGEDVARAVEVIRESGLEHELGPSGTTIVGEWDEVFETLKTCHEVVSDGQLRVASVIKVDHKPGGFAPGAIRAKVDRVAARPDEGGQQSR